MIRYLNSTGKYIKINKRNKWNDSVQVKYVKINFYLFQQVPKKDIGKNPLMIMAKIMDYVELCNSKGIEPK